MLIGEKVKCSVFTGICLITLCANVNVFAQDNYSSYESRKKELIRQGDSIMALHKSVLPAEVEAQVDIPASHKLNLPTTKSTVKLTDNEVYKQAKPAVLVIGMMSRRSTDSVSQINLASGYVIDPSGICVSNYHVMMAYSYSQKNASYAFVAQNGLGKTFAISKILYASAEDDLAVFQLDLGNTGSLPFLTLANKDAEIGTPIYMLGHPQGMFYFFSKGIVANTYSEHLQLQNNKGYGNRNMMAITADFGVGASGGPILDENGNVVATVSNTRAVTSDGMGRGTLQMIIKNTIPISSLKKLVSNIQ